MLDCLRSAIDTALRRFACECLRQDALLERVEYLWAREYADPKIRRVLDAVHEANVRDFDRRMAELRGG